MTVFKPAVKENLKLRMAVFGPSGSGKTMSSLKIAAGLGGKVAVIDTERGSASKYADLHPFDVAELEADKSIDAYVKTLEDAGKAGYEVIIIDSLSHAWQELLDEVDKLTKTKYKGNSWQAWSDGTPRQRRLVDAILRYPGHVIATMRSKTEWTTEKDERSGKTKPVRVGLAPEQGKGIEYEFDMLMELSPDNYASFIKDRTGKFQGRILERPDEQVGRDIKAWLSSAPTTPTAQPTPRPETAAEPVEAVREPVTISEKRVDGLRAELQKLGIDTSNEAQVIETAFGLSELERFTDLTDGEAVILWQRLKRKAAEDAKPAWQKWQDDNDAIAYGSQSGTFSGGGHLVMLLWDQTKDRVGKENGGDLSGFYEEWQRVIDERIAEERKAA